MKRILIILLALCALRPTRAMEQNNPSEPFDPKSIEALRMLKRAANRGHLDEVKKLIKAGVDINRKDTANNTAALHVAVMRGHKAIVTELLQAGALMDIEAINQETPLRIATEQQNIEIMELLLNAGADVNKTTPEGLTYLHFAAWEGNLKAVTLLLNHKADVHVHAANFRNATALHQAANNGQNLVVNCLLKAGANCTALDSNGATPLIHAVRHGRIEVATTLLTAIPPTEYTAIRNCFTGLLALNRIQPLHPALSKDIRRLLAQKIIELFSNEQEQRIREQIAVPMIVNGDNTPEAARVMAYAVHLNQPTENSEAMFHLLDLSNVPNKAMLLKKVKANIGHILLSKSDDEL